MSDPVLAVLPLSWASYSLGYLHKSCVIFFRWFGLRVDLLCGLFITVVAFSSVLLGNQSKQQFCEKGHE